MKCLAKIEKKRKKNKYNVAQPVEVAWSGLTDRVPQDRLMVSMHQNLRIVTGITNFDDRTTGDMGA